MIYVVILLMVLNWGMVRRSDLSLGSLVYGKWINQNEQTYIYNIVCIYI